MSLELSISRENFSISNICPIVIAIGSIRLVAWRAEVNPQAITTQTQPVVIATDLTITCSTHYISLITDHYLTGLIPLIGTTD